ncbi:translation initiation factor 2B subunit I family (IF-2BI) [Pyrobaculum islandicum DSM 4184]|uniref:Putative methylthioribose-1-phosphate isomerase n=1 Tax=Pyrobaculum islandicum (strain DSM 4184 / JCM 9189 / GEO3) TaxID=384616 RepID=A1RSA9_PYRIL|nr:S-methyl-5-thioribose-1-phosphate isomerase [Pyrobaculum islandicum]ABL87841.1 translation initiation factor 2B subunit I family (IF-2BI) [Pyrobaculum islandicum DSM 4184]
MEKLVEELKRKFRPKIKPIEWKGDKLVLLDQRFLPFETRYFEARTVADVAEAIRNMVVRGAPAIGITAAFGMVLSLVEKKPRTVEEALNTLTSAKETLAKTRPTAVNLFWALERMYNKATEIATSTATVDELKSALEEEAKRIFEEELDAEIRIGLYGAELLENGDTVLTICNAGGLATGTGLGTATAPIYVSMMLGKQVSVVAPETRPWQQGARLTVYELIQNGVPTKLIADTAVGLVMLKRLVNIVMVGADRILLDGHVYNKIGTLNEAVLAHEFGIPFYVLAPTSTIDPKSRVEDVEIEERDPDEVRTARSNQGIVYVTLKEVPVYNPVFDVTPPKYITGIITEKGVATQPLYKNLRKLLNM